MSHTNTTSRPSRRLLAVILGVLVGALFLAPSFLYLKDQSPACQTQLHQEDRNSNSLSLHQDQRGGYRLQYQAGESAEHCKWGHTADEWIAGLTGALVAFTAGLATFTALLWWTTYDLWRSAEDGERVRERAYIRVSLTGNNVLSSMNSAEMRATGRAARIPPSEDFGFSGDGGALRQELLLLAPWNPPHVTFRVTNHGKTPADLLSGQATFSFIASHDPTKIGNKAFEAITFNRSSLAPTESTDAEDRFPDTVFEETDAISLKNQTNFAVLFFECVVVYKDIWEDTHTEMFRAVWNPTRSAFDISRWENEIRLRQEGPLLKKLRRNRRIARRWRLILKIWGPASRWLERRESQCAQENGRS